METYVETLLRRQREMSRSLLQEEARDVEGHTVGGSAGEPEETSALRQEQAAVEDTEGAAQAVLLERLEELERGTAGVQVLRQRILQEKLEKTQVLQRESLMERRPENTSGGHTGSYSRMLQADGIAGSPTQRSMQEISRYFERDSRRYG